MRWWRWRSGVVVGGMLYYVMLYWKVNWTWILELLGRLQGGGGEVVLEYRVKLFNLYTDCILMDKGTGS